MYQSIIATFAPPKKNVQIHLIRFTDKKEAPRKGFSMLFK